MDSTAKLLSGVYGPPLHKYELWLSDRFGNRLQKLDTIESGRVSFSNFSDTAWKLETRMAATDAFDPLKDTALLTDTVSAGGQSRMFPMGLYLFDRPDDEHWERYSQWTLTGRSTELILLQDMPVSYFAAAGTDVLDAVSTIATGRGVPASMIDFPPVTKTLRNDFSMTVSNSTDGGWWYRICTALLNAAGFYALTTTGTGRLTTSLQEDLTSRDPDVVYGPKGDGMLVPPLGGSWEGDRFANKVMVVSQDAQDMPPLVSVRENHNPESAGSIERLGRRVMKAPITLQTTTSQADLDRIADAELQKATSFLRKMSLSTFPDPRLGPQQVYEIRGAIQDGKGEPVKGVWSVTSWEQQIGAKRSATTHAVSRIEGV